MQPALIGARSALPLVCGGRDFDAVSDGYKSRNRRSSQIAAGIPIRLVEIDFLTFDVVPQVFLEEIVKGAIPALRIDPEYSLHSTTGSSLRRLPAIPGQPGARWRFYAGTVT